MAFTRTRAAVCAFTLLAAISAAGAASAAPCGNLLNPAAATPAGFGAAYNPLSPAKELLLQGTECAAGAARISVGSGGAKQYVYKNALYWTGSAWQELPLSGSALVSDTWYKGSATASMPIGETPRYLLGYVCQSSAGAWKCGCSDATCAKPQWQLQAIQAPAGSGGGTVPATGVCAAGAAPPAQAAAAGLTKLAFCDDFSTDTVARGTTTAARDITGAKKWTTERAANFGSVPPTSADSFVFNSDGTLTVTPNEQQFQWFMSSTALRDNALKGFWIAKKPKFYAEIRWKFKKGASTAQQPAFWSMDACHLYGKPAPCSAKNANRFIEPDFWEYYFAAWGTHYYENASPARDLARCTDQNGAIRLAEDQWFTAGTLVTDVPEMKYYKDDKLVFTRTTSSACSERNTSGVKTASFIRELKDGDYPILIGSKDKEIITIDYVRVWLAP